MQVIKATNVHQALPEAVYQLLRLGNKRESRFGEVVVAPGPVATQYGRPQERVLFWPRRDANPTFHLLEALWMLAGRNDVRFPASMVPSFSQFSDDGVTFNGAYGQRWREQFMRDQILAVADALKENPTDRRQVISMWDGMHDPSQAEEGSKDVPCNTHAYVSVSAEGKLDLTVCCRSNDIIWGCYGANAVHFSMLQEIIALLVGVPVGTYVQFSNNWHGYTKTLEPLLPLANEAASGTTGVSRTHCPYSSEAVSISPLGHSPEDAHTLLSEVDGFLGIDILEHTPIGFKSKFLRKIAQPMRRAYQEFKVQQGENKYFAPLRIFQEEGVQGSDWHQAAIEWYERRLIRFKENQIDE